MDEYPIALQALVDWLNSKAFALEGTGVSFAGTQQTTLHVPAAFANFDARHTMGRVNGWVSREIDFEILRLSDGKMIFFQHVKASSIGDSALDIAYASFLKNMTQGLETLASL